jgi:iron complex transport system substrate-binding protein
MVCPVGAGLRKKIRIFIVGLFAVLIYLRIPNPQATRSNRVEGTIHSKGVPMMDQMEKTPLRVIIFLFLLCWGMATSQGETDSVAPPVPQRIVSLAPSTTEILFDLGLGSKVVGVTRFCDYPSSATSVAKIGGLMDMNYEAIVKLHPDLAVLLTTHRDAQRELSKVKIKTLLTPHEKIADIHEAIRMIGEACAAQDAASQRLDNLTSRTEVVRRAVEKCPRPRVLVCVGRDASVNELNEIYVAGRHTFYDEIIEAAGGVNAFPDGKIPYPQITPEGVLRINPDVIIDLVTEHIGPGKKNPEQIVQQWNVVRLVNAVRKHQVFVLNDNDALRPGPRYIQFLEKLAHLLHPDAFPGESRHD